MTDTCRFLPPLIASPGSFHLSQTQLNFMDRESKLHLSPARRKDGWKVFPWHGSYVAGYIPTFTRNSRISWRIGFIDWRRAMNCILSLFLVGCMEPGVWCDVISQFFFWCFNGCDVIIWGIPRSLCKKYGTVMAMEWAYPNPVSLVDLLHGLLIW